LIFRQYIFDKYFVRLFGYQKVGHNNRLLRMRPTFSKLVMVSVGASKLGSTAVHFVEPRSQSESRILSQQSTWTEVAARRTPVIPGRIFCVLTGRCPHTSSTQHHHFSGATDARLHTFVAVAAEFARLETDRISFSFSAPKMIIFDGFGHFRFWPKMF